MMRSMVVLAGSALLASCGGDASMNSEGDAGVSDATDPSLEACPEQSVCLTVVPLVPEEPMTPGRVAVVWYQIRDVSGVVETKVAWDAPLEPDQRRVSIPIREIELPDDDQLVCQWESGVCLHDAMPPPVGFAYVVVGTDENRSGRLDPGEYSMGAPRGSSDVSFVWSRAAHAPGSDALTSYGSREPNYLGVILTEGVKAGIAAYDQFPMGGEATLKDHDPSVEREIVVCPTSFNCTVALWPLVGSDRPY